MEAFKKLISDRLRLAAGAQVLTAAAHPDPDTLSAFAERALSDGERKSVLEHLVSCRECREILYLAHPSSPEMQQAFAVGGHRSAGFAMRWGTLAAAIAVAAILVVSMRHGSQSPKYRSEQYQSAAPPTAAPANSADLKTPPEIAEMHALRDDRAGMASKKEADKVIPTLKHMTAKPAGKFDIDQTGQVRISPRVNTGPALESNSPAPQANSATLNQLDSGTVSAAPTPAAAVGGTARTEQLASSTPTAFRGANAGSPIAANRTAMLGTITDPSGAVISNATITVTGPAGTRALQSDRQGQFALERLTPGSYSVQAQAPGFRTTLQQVAVLAEKPANLQMTLGVGEASETLEVTGQAVSAVQSAEVSQSQISEGASAKQRKRAKAEQRASGQGATQNANAALAPASRAFTSASPPAPFTVQWTLAADGTVQRSLDSGNSWGVVAVVGAARFRALSSIGADVWVGGNAGALYHSSDSGQSWDRVVPSSSGQKLDSDITRVEFSDAQNGSLTTASGQTWTTSDGGKSWTVK